MAISSAPHRGRRSPLRNQVALVALVVLAAIGVVLLVHDVILGSPSPGGVQGSGVAATQTRALASFTGVELAGADNVTVVVGGQQSVVVHADGNLLRYVTTRVAAGNLVIGTSGSFTTKSPMSVDVSVPSLAVLKLSGSGVISVSGITEPSLTVTLSGSGVLHASGAATRLDVTLSGAGQADLSYFVAHDVHAVVTGSGLIRVTATASLDAAVPGTGAIIYGGNPPRVTSSVTGTGAVMRR
jgi:Putative auto-transporter adhesin, head GIN domain